MNSQAAHFTPEDALVALMVTIAVSDENIAISELINIEQIINHVPIFANYDLKRLPTISQIVYDLMEEEDGLEALFSLVKAGLPEELNETAYAFACDIAAADGMLEQTELILLETIRHEMNISRLHAASIEYAAKIRNRKL